MTKDKDFKKLVRARMTETGENFTTARTALLTANQSAETASESYIDPQIARFRTKTLKTFMPDGRIVSIPTKRRALVIVLIEVLAALDPDRVYDEKQLGAILGEFHPDFALLRRELIDYRLLGRNPHTGEYWVNPDPPTHTGSQAQEMAGLEVFLR
ncbi:hypothetical protein SAMN04489752_2641 [Brevibacterium siliguriense]|uniref:DUF2087 domain-containing protein n=1 Tax=Brevibacterium siliguriense TaxID=1136497 RepID=A0A1H1VFS0_9MICO|nr:DUF2087 domain-containing protein [Brevibacterium siliguriense]SDS83515.1 hypothetical protein SAMN04489752_2641 [Brevibacterium siliguriense]